MEQVWAFLKRHWASTVVELNGDVSINNFSAVLEQCIEQKVRYNCQKYADSAFEVFKSVLDGKVV